MTSERALQLILRVMGSSSLLALFFIGVPHSWMESIHASLEMCPLPDAPVVGYLARSTSAFYAMAGGLFWVVSFDLERHRRVLIFLGGAITALGFVLLVVDWAEGLPFWWAIWEGPFVVAFGIVLSWLSRRIAPGPGARPEVP